MKSKMKISTSKCKWSPFDGKKFKGCPVATIIGGKIKVKNGEIPWRC